MVEQTVTEILSQLLWFSSSVDSTFIKTNVSAGDSTLLLTDISLFFLSVQTFYLNLFKLGTAV